ncbi:MAG TPA: phosphate ABC transporter substrate-binding protein [Anaerolineales bacterium]|nr:phosphate ABC transporter substrate-binding protein [Anaerolineales bacterium]
MRAFKRFLLLLIICLLAACGPANAGTAQSQMLYIQDKGSDTIVNLALAWAEKYQAEHANVSISVTGGGTGTGIAALLNRTTDIANASRQMQAVEIQQAKAKGLDPIEFVVARDAIAVAVNPSNPVDRLTFQQISDIYSGKINNWLQVGGLDRPIVRLSREVNSGTHVYFRDTVVRLGDANNKTLFATDTLLLPSSEGIVSELRQNPNAIGYDGLGYIPADLKTIAVAKDAAGPFVLPSVATVNNKSYPIARDLYMYTAGQPSGVVKTYLDWIVSSEAQAIVVELGFVPISK